MGFFDTLTCEYPLPEPTHQGLAFQTKSLGCALAHYTITRDGGLVQYAWRDGKHAREREWPFHGDVLMYASHPDGEWVEYLVRFTHAKVEWVVKWERAAAGAERLEDEWEPDEELLDACRASCPASMADP